MKRFLALSLCFGVLSLVGFSGCGEETKTETKSTTQTPGGSVTETKTDKVNATGDAKTP